MRTGFLITARLKSTRLPNKILREIKGKPILSHMIDRIKRAKHVNEIVICTSTDPQDQPLSEIAMQNHVSCFFGHPDDVLKRLHDATEKHRFDYIINITADCPFVDPQYADQIAASYEKTKADLICAYDLPHGAYSWGIKPTALRKVMEIKDSIQTEVWGKYFTDTDLFDVYHLPITNKLHCWPDLRMTLDYPEDLAFFEEVFEHLYHEDRVFDLTQIVNLIREHPEIREINRHCASKYKKRHASQSEIKLKPRHSVSKIAIVGCGSIGQRHIRNLNSLGIRDVMALRTRKGFSRELPKDIQIREVDDWKTVVAFSPDVAIISNPSILHVESALKLTPHVRGLFIEKPLSHSTERIKELVTEIAGRKIISYVGFDMQLHPAVRVIQEHLESAPLGRPLLYQGQVGHWLPHWHPYEDHTKSYSARRELGGGAALTLIHEVQMALSFLGDAVKVSAVFPPYAELDLDVEPIASMMIHHASGAVSQLHLDFVQRAFHRAGTISCEKGWIRYDLVNGDVRCQLEDDKSPRTIWTGAGYDRNDQFLEEMKRFLGYVREGRMRHPFDVWHALQSLAVVEAAFASATQDTFVRIPDWITKLSST